jgi:hypothetical protein
MDSTCRLGIHHVHEHEWTGPNVHTRAPSSPVASRNRAFDPRVAHRGRARADLLAALISFVLSVSLWFLGYREEGLLVGIWVPTIVSLGAFLVPRRAEQ